MTHLSREEHGHEQLPSTQHSGGPAADGGRRAAWGTLERGAAGGEVSQASSVRAATKLDSIQLSKLEELRHPHVVRYYVNSLTSDADDISIVMEDWGVSVSSLIAGKQHCDPEHIARQGRSCRR